jgi:hypothetical protein
MAMKILPMDWYFEGRVYQAGILQEVPDELARYVDEYSEKESKKLEELEKVQAIGVDSIYATQNPDAYQNPEVIVETTTQESTAGLLSDEPTGSETLAAKRKTSK